MPRTLDPEVRRALAARIRYYNEMGIYDFYRRPVSAHRQEVAAPIAVDEQEIAVSINPESGEDNESTEGLSGRGADGAWG